MKYRVWANSCDFGVITAESEREAKNIACQMCGYDSVADMVEKLDQPSELKAVKVDDSAQDSEFYALLGERKL